MATKRWVRVRPDPFGEEQENGIRLAWIDSGTGLMTNEAKPDLSVIITLKQSEGEQPELGIACGPATDPADLGMDLMKGVSFNGELAVAVMALVALAGHRLTVGGAGNLFGLGGHAFVVQVEDH